MRKRAHGGTPPGWHRKSETMKTSERRGTICRALRSSAPRSVVVEVLSARGAIIELSMCST
jgi:hypothetical protein